MTPAPEPTPTPLHCPRCQQPLPRGHAAGNCAACLLATALAADPDETVQEDEWPEESPQELGDFEILGEIGRGGTGVVYRARQRSVNRIVALKTLHGAALNRRAAFQRLRIEAEAVGRLEHPNIVPLYELGCHAGTHFLTLRYFEHGSLADLLKRRRFGPEEAAQLIRTAARAIHHAHQRGVLHRDIKPSNLLLDEHGEPHVADFGLAKLADDDSSPTLSTSVLGTPAYMAPECAGGQSKQAGVPSDIYGLGAMLFELLTGRPPFVGSSALEVLRQVGSEEPPRPRDLNPALDRDLEAVCLKCLERDPVHRYGTAAALADDLDRWLRHEPLDLRRVSTAERLGQWVRRRPLVATLAGGLGVAVIAGLLTTTWQAQRATSAARQAREAEQIARRHAYTSDMNLAAQAAEENPGLARELLDRHRPHPGQSDLRGWEWRYLWQLTRPDSIAILGKTNRSIFSVAVAGDGRWLGVGEFNGGFSLWDLASRKCVWVNHEIAIHEGIFSGTRVAAAGAQDSLAYSISLATNRHEIRMLDPASQTVRWVAALSAQARMLAISGDGRRLVASTMEADPEIMVWDAGSGRPLNRFPVPGRGRPVHNRGNPLAISADGRWVAIDEFPGHVQVIDLDSGERRWRFKTADAQVCALAFSPDGRTLAVGTAYQEWMIRLWNLDTGESAGRLEGHRGWISCLQFRADGRTLVSASQDQTVRIWDLKTREAIQLLNGHSKEIWSLAMLPDGDQLVTGGKDGEIRLWSLRAIRPKAAQVLAPAVKDHRFEFSADGRNLWAVASNGVIFRAHGPGFRALEWKTEWGTNNASAAETSDGRYLMIGQADGLMALRSLPGGEEVRRVSASKAPVIVLPIPRDARPFCYTDGRYCQWNLSATKIEKSWTTDALQTSGSAYPDGSGFITIRHDGTYWHQPFQRADPDVGHLDQREVMGLVLSPDMRLLATASDFGEAKLWATADHRPVATLGGFLGAVRGLAFSPDGTRLATGAGGADSLCLWELKEGRRLIRIRTESAILYPLRFSPDGNTIVAQDVFSGQLRVWMAPPWDEIAARESVH